MLSPQERNTVIEFGDAILSAANQCGKIYESAMERGDTLMAFTAVMFFEQAQDFVRQIDRFYETGR